jgi:hypothetical protein
MASAGPTAGVKVEHLNRYATGWTNGDAETILGSLSPSYVLDDPNVGRITTDEFAAYFSELRETVEGLGGGKVEGAFLELSDVMTEEGDGVLTAWCWWRFSGTPIEGSGLIKVSEEGVLSERLSYYTRLS